MERLSGSSAVGARLLAASPEPDNGPAKFMQFTEFLENPAPLGRVAEAAASVGGRIGSFRRPDR
jgi:hypothetical protein